MVTKSGDAAYVHEAFPALFLSCLTLTLTLTLTLSLSSLSLALALALALITAF